MMLKEQIMKMIDNSDDANANYGHLYANVISELKDELENKPQIEIDGKPSMYISSTHDDPDESSRKTMFRFKG